MSIGTVDKLCDRLEPIERIARDLAKYAKKSKDALIDFQPETAMEHLVSMLAQLEVLRLRCGSLQKDKAFLELGE